MVLKDNQTAHEVQLPQAPCQARQLLQLRLGRGMSASFLQDILGLVKRDIKGVYQQGLLVFLGRGAQGPEEGFLGGFLCAFTSRGCL